MRHVQTSTALGSNSQGAPFQKTSENKSMQGPKKGRPERTYSIPKIDNMKYGTNQLRYMSPSRVQLGASYSTLYAAVECLFNIACFSR